MKNIKKQEKWSVIYALLTVLIMVMLLAACGGNNENIPEDEIIEEADTYTLPPNDISENGGITPLMWRVTSPAGQSIYLFGSIHVAEESIYPLPGFIMDAFDSSEYLAVEIDFYAIGSNHRL